VQSRINFNHFLIASNGVAFYKSKLPVCHPANVHNQDCSRVTGYSEKGRRRCSRRNWLTQELPITQFKLTCCRHVNVTFDLVGPLDASAVSEKKTAYVLTESFVSGDAAVFFFSI